VDLTGQLSLAIPLWVGTMSTNESCDINRHTHNVLAAYPWSRSVNRYLAQC